MLVVEVDVVDAKATQAGLARARASRTRASHWIPNLVLWCQAYDDELYNYHSLQNIYILLDSENGHQIRILFQRLAF
jgi:hypothetical protein